MSNRKLQDAVNTAALELRTAHGRSAEFRLAIIDLDGSTDLKWGGWGQDDLDFTASEAKVIALYSAFALRDFVRRFEALRFFRTTAVGSRAKTASLFDDLRSEVDPHILAAGHPLLATTKVSERLPTWERVFVARSGTPPEFTQQFKDWLRAMIVPSSNPAAGECIRNIGYAYISGTMKAALLFENGIGPWLAGDFMGLATYARIDSKNDQGVGQAGTALSMAKLMAIIVLKGATLDGDSFTKMMELLHDAVRGPDTPFLTRTDEFTDGFKHLVIPTDRITHIKLGQDWLKPVNGKLWVAAEVWRVEGLLNARKVYALSFQNLLLAKNRFEDVAFMIRRSIDLYEK